MSSPHSNFKGRSVLISTVSEEPYDMDAYPTTSQSSNGHEEGNGRQGEAFYQAYP